MKKFAAIFIVVLMLLVSVVPAFAAQVDSPQASTRRGEVIFIPGEEGGGTVKEEWDDDEGHHVIIVPDTPRPGHDFDHWEIIGDYTAKGELTDSELEIIVNGDVQIIPVYKDKNGTVETGTVNTDTSNKSPQTGSSDVLPYAIVILSLAACGVVTLKLVKSK